MVMSQKFHERDMNIARNSSTLTIAVVPPFNCSVSVPRG